MPKQPSKKNVLFNGKVPIVAKNIMGSYEMPALLKHSVGDRIEDVRKFCDSWLYVGKGADGYIFRNLDTDEIRIEKTMVTIMSVDPAKGL